MFKKYVFGWSDVDGVAHTVDFFVHSRKTRNGFQHRACALGPIPRLDDKDADYYKCRAHDVELSKKRVHKISYINRTWECFSGQECLAQLWEKLAKLKFVDMGRISLSNPFRGQEEPPNEGLYDPDALFSMF